MTNRFNLLDGIPGIKPAQPPKPNAASTPYTAGQHLNALPNGQPHYWMDASLREMLSGGGLQSQFAELPVSVKQRQMYRMRANQALDPSMAQGRVDRYGTSRRRTASREGARAGAVAAGSGLGRAGSAGAMLDAQNRANAQAGEFAMQEMGSQGELARALQGMEVNSSSAVMDLLPLFSSLGQQLVARDSHELSNRQYNESTDGGFLGEALGMIGGVTDLFGGSGLGSLFKKKPKASASSSGDANDFISMLLGGGK